jgi:hypothetical protein
LPVDQFQRYRVIKDLVDSYGSGAGSVKVLDVGGYPGHLIEFLPDKDVTVVDLPPCDRPRYLQVDGQRLPFPDGSFDIVSTVDVFEHVEPAARLKFLEELIRVSKDVVLLEAPFHDTAKVLAEELIYEYVSEVQNQQFLFLREHLELGLPVHAEVDEFLDKNNLSFVKLPSGYFYHWLIMMFISQSLTDLPGGLRFRRILHKFYNRQISPFDNAEPAYRTVYVISRNSPDYIDRVGQLYARTAPLTDRELREKIMMAADLFEIQSRTAETLGGKEFRAEMNKMSENVASFRQEIRRLDQTVNEQEATIKERDETIANLRTWLDEIHNRPIYKVYARAKRLIKRR